MIIWCNARVVVTGREKCGLHVSIDNNNALRTVGFRDNVNKCCTPAFLVVLFDKKRQLLILNVGKFELNS